MMRTTLTMTTSTLMTSSLTTLSAATTTNALSSTVSTGKSSSSIKSNATPQSPPSLPPPPPIVYTIAGSDSGGGAGIQADLHAIQSMGCHGCSAITCLTAQNSMGVTSVHTPPVSFLNEQLKVLSEDLVPRAIKIGMLGSKEMALAVGSFIRTTGTSCEKHESESESGDDNNKESPCRPFVVLDPVMISTSGHKLIDEEAKQAMIEHVFPYVDLLTPNKFEAEELLGHKLSTIEEVEQGARDILSMGVKAVLIKGGHSLSETNTNNPQNQNGLIGNKYAQDYYLSSSIIDEETPKLNEERLCDCTNSHSDKQRKGVWLRSIRYDTIHTHGTGCTLSSAIASSLAIGHQQREIQTEGGTGAARAIHLIDAIVLAKAYVTAGISKGSQLGKGPGPVVHTTFPSSHSHFPSIVTDPKNLPHPTTSIHFRPMRRASSPSSSSSTSSYLDNDIPQLGKILPIVNTSEWVESLCKLPHITDIQLRIKDETITNDPNKVQDMIQKAQAYCEASNVRLWINDYWEEAIRANCFGVHLGQEDLCRCARDGGLEQLRKHNLALGISTHSYGELAAALGIHPSYISLGPIFGTKSKDVAFDPQGLDTLRQWRKLVGSYNGRHDNDKDIEDDKEDTRMPLVAIGGINDSIIAREVRDAGADCIAVIGAVTKVEDVENAVNQLMKAMS